MKRREEEFLEESKRMHAGSWRMQRLPGGFLRTLGRFRGVTVGSSLKMCEG